MSAAEPFGETRADIRSALNTAATITNTAVAQVAEDRIQELFEKLVTYLDGNEEKVVSPDEAARMLG